MDQIDPYNVPELFRGVPKPKDSSKKYKQVINITLPKMEKRICFKSARTKTVDSHNSIDSIGSIDCIDSIDSIESEDSTDSIDSIDFIDSIDSIDAILVPHKRSPTFTPHTKGHARCARANNNTNGLLCGPSIESIESIKCIESIGVCRVFRLYRVY